MSYSPNRSRGVGGTKRRQLEKGNRIPLVDHADVEIDDTRTGLIDSDRKHRKPEKHLLRRDAR
jgi:hypothetical protein